MAQAYEISRHFKGLRVETGRRKSRRDPFAETFDDDSEEEKNRRSRSKTKQPSPAEKEKPSTVAPAKTTAPLPSAAEVIRDSEDDVLGPSKRTDRRPSPAPSQLPLSRVTDGAGRRGSLDVGLQSKGLTSRSVQTTKTPRAAVALAAGQLAYLDDSSEDEEEVPPARINRYPSPAPRKKSDDAGDGIRRSSTPKGSREPNRDAFQAAAAQLPTLHTVASPFAGTKYLQDSESDEDEDEDEDEEAVGSRKNSAEEIPSVSSSPDKHRLEVKRVDKPKQNGGGVSWRAFSAGRAEQRTAEIEAIQTSLRHRGKSISFGTHAVTDDGNRVPVTASPEQIFGGTRGRKPRGKSPPRRAEDTKPTEDEILDGGPVGIYDPTRFKTNPFTGQYSGTSRLSKCHETGLTSES